MAIRVGLIKDLNPFAVRSGCNDVPEVVSSIVSPLRLSFSHGLSQGMSARVTHPVNPHEETPPPVFFLMSWTSKARNIFSRSFIFFLTCSGVTTSRTKPKTFSVC